MLVKTFKHLRGIGPEFERTLWSRGIQTWDDFRRQAGEQLSLFGASSHLLEESERAYLAGDAGFFAQRLHPSDYYRIALAFPDETVFLDIESTGLSLYYDQLTLVGWSVGANYEVFVTGQDPGRLWATLEKAKVVVTFNGTLFDLKFLRKTFGTMKMAAAHLDLRYFARRVGLAGGQKAIEREIGLRRDEDLEELLGEHAPVLWHQYRRGDNAALKKLIRYNHWDVEGMKVILDEAIRRTLIRESVPLNLRPNISFSSQRSVVDWADGRPTNGQTNVIFVGDYSGDARPLLTFSELSQLRNLDDLCVVGLDLVSSEDRETGCCVLKGRSAYTSRVKTDDEMIQLILESGANVVSIDSPLSIPKGRTSYFDDDPGREEFGITRLCERVLKRRGINVYPCLIQSMQRLTQRGVELAAKLRRLGIATIESYPGAAQDIMGIPRKQAGLKYLTDGLVEFGIEGKFSREPVSHDELDAITSAIVGLFFWTGMFEALGNDEEDYLIVPDLNADPERWLARCIFGISGEIAAGKTTVAEYLQSNGYKATRYSLVLENFLRGEAIEPNRENLQSIGRRINSEQGQRWLGRQALELVGDANHIAVDGLRFLEDRAFIIETFGPAFELIFVEASAETRARRMAGSLRENLSLAVAQGSKTETEVALLKQKADFVIENELAIDSLYEQVEAILKER